MTDSTKKDVLNSFTKLNEQKRQHLGHYETKYYYTKQVYILFFNPFDHRVKSQGKPTYSPGELTSGKLASSKTTAIDEYYTKKIQLTSGIARVANTIMMGRLGLILLRHNSFPDSDFATVWYE